MKQVLYPKYLLGGMMQRGGGIGAAERGEADGVGGRLRNIAGRWPDADAILQGGMSEGLRDWDLWGPLIFCLLLSLFLSWGAKGDQRDLVFSGVFAMVWIGEAVVTLQIKLLGGNMCVDGLVATWYRWMLTVEQRLLSVHLHHRLHAVPARHCVGPQRRGHTGHRADTRVYRADCVVAGSRRQHHGRIGRGEEPGRDCSIPLVCILRCARLSLLHQLVWSLRRTACSGSVKSRVRRGRACLLAVPPGVQERPGQARAALQMKCTYCTTTSLDACLHPACRARTRWTCRLQRCYAPDVRLPKTAKGTQGAATRAHVEPVRLPHFVIGSLQRQRTRPRPTTGANPLHPANRSNPPKARLCCSPPRPPRYRRVLEPTGQLNIVASAHCLWKFGTQRFDRLR